MKIRRDVYGQIIDHARRALPHEACGYLAGTDGVFTLAYALSNMDQSPEHFSFDPQEQFAAVKAARVKGLEINAVYHSHPATPARPSVEDIRLAFDPDKLYVIVSLADGQNDVKAFWIKGGQVTIENLEVVDATL